MCSGNDGNSGDGGRNENNISDGRIREIGIRDVALGDRDQGSKSDMIMKTASVMLGQSC